MTSVQGRDLKSGGDEQDDWWAPDPRVVKSYLEMRAWLWGFAAEGAFMSEARLTNAGMTIDTPAAQPLVIDPGDIRAAIPCLARIQGV